MLHITVSVQYKVGTVGLWAGCALSKTPGVPALFYSALLSFGSHDCFSAKMGEKGPVVATADGGYLMLSEEALRACWTDANNRCHDTSPLFTAAALNGFICVGRGVPGFRDRVTGGLLQTPKELHQAG